MRNYGRMMERRVAFGTSVHYETPLEHLEKLPGLLRDIVTAEKDVRFDRAHFKQHGVASIDFETVYYVMTPDYNRYMDIQQSINLRIHRKFLELRIPFASSTQRELLRYPEPEAAAKAESSAPARAEIRPARKTN